MGTTGQRELIESLQRKIDESLVPYLPGIEELILLDFPNHANVGDSAIYAGELAFFNKKLFARPSIVSDTINVPWERIAASSKNDPIFLHGGGNFGDLWPQHQEFRESVLRRFPGRLVIQLPQSIHYSDTRKISQTAQVIREHGNFVLLVRDDASYEIAKNNFRCEVKRSPDMAFHLGPLKVPQQPEHELLLLLRNDREKRREEPDNALSLPLGTVVTDWLDDKKAMKAGAKAATAIKALLRNETGRMSVRRNYYEILAMNRLQRGVRLLSSGGFIITDRLHVHIISILLDIQHVVLDNNYGKVSRFIDLWTNGFTKMTQAESLSRALDLYKSTEAR